MPRGPQLTTIYWRDIPAQVNAKTRGAKHQVLLKPRFQQAIDRAAMVAGITTSSDYVGEWRQVAAPIEGDLEAAAEAEAARLDEAFPLERINEFVNEGAGIPVGPSPNEAPNQNELQAPPSRRTTPHDRHRDQLGDQGGGDRFRSPLRDDR